MALVLDTLATSLADLFRGVNGYPATPAAAGDAWASAYASYAQHAVATSLPPTVITTAPVAASVAAAQSTLATALGAAFAAHSSIPDLAANLASAFAAFWLGVSFALAAATGATLPPVTPPLTSALGAFFGPAPRGDAEAQARGLATVLDTWTRTVAVTNTAGAVTAVALLA